MAPWLRVLETYLVQALLRTPAFHRGVEKVVKNVHRIRHGLPPEEMGGTKIDQPGNSSFLKHFSEEVQTQLGRAEGKSSDAAVKSAGETTEGSAEEVWKANRRRIRAEKKPVEEVVVDADAAWENARKKTEQGAKKGFIGEYIEALREQTRNGR